jgi:hypothetical protein
MFLIPSQLAQPYLKELVDMRDGSAFLSGIKAFGKKIGLRPEDIAQAVGQPRKVAYIEQVCVCMCMCMCVCVCVYIYVCMCVLCCVWM